MLPNMVGGIDGSPVRELDPTRDNAFNLRWREAKDTRLRYTLQGIDLY
jgi:hypothetical protein